MHHHPPASGCGLPNQFAEPCPTPGLDPGHHRGSARPGVGLTPGFTANAGVPGCAHHSEARVIPHLPPCPVYRIAYTRL